MFACLHDQGLGVVRRLASDIGELVDREVSQLIPGVHTAISQLANQFGGQTFEVAQILRDFVHAFFMGDFHRQQSILGAIAQLVDGVFVKALNFQHFLQWHVGHFFQAGEAFGNQNVGDFLVHIELFHEQLATGIGFHCQLSVPTLRRP